MRITDEQLDLLEIAYATGDVTEPNRLTVRALIAEVRELRRLLVTTSPHLTDAVHGCIVGDGSGGVVGHADFIRFK